MSQQNYFDVILFCCSLSLVFYYPFQTCSVLAPHSWSAHGTHSGKCMQSLTQPVLQNFFFSGLGCGLFFVFVLFIFFNYRAAFYKFAPLQSELTATNNKSMKKSKLHPSSKTLVVSLGAVGWKQETEHFLRMASLWLSAY